MGQGMLAQNAALGVPGNVNNGGASNALPALLPLDLLCLGADLPVSMCAASASSIHFVGPEAAVCRPMRRPLP